MTTPQLADELTDRIAYLETILRQALPVVEYVSTGRGFVDVEPYPDARARRVNYLIRFALGEIPA